jgi:ABC-type xylose transport system permease subunit
MDDVESQSSADSAVATLRAAVKVLGPLGIATAALFFFGWVRTRALFSYFGVDLGLLGLSSTDYILRSGEVVFLPAAGLAVLVGVATAVRWQLRNRAAFFREHPRRSAVLEGFLYGAGGLGLLLAVGGAAGASSQLLGAPSLAVGAFLLVEGHLMRGRRVQAAGQRAGAQQVTAALLVAVTFSVFWSTAIFAERAGLAFAASIESGAVDRPDVLVYSQTPLALPYQESTGYVPAPGERKFQYSYTHLRLLTFSNDRWFLLGPAGTATVVLRDSDSIRVQLNP